MPPCVGRDKEQSLILLFLDIFIVIIFNLFYLSDIYLFSSTGILL